MHDIDQAAGFDRDEICFGAHGDLKSGNEKEQSEQHAQVNVTTRCFDNPLNAQVERCVTGAMALAYLAL